MLTIHTSGMTRGVRVIWLCEELGLDLNVHTIDFSAAYRSSPEWRAMNPVGKVPALTDGDVTMFESGAMVQYILDRYGDGRLQPAAGSPEAALYQQWCWFSEATFARPIGDLIHHTKLRPEPDRIAAVVPDAIDRATVCLDALEAQLAGRDWLLDELSGADVMMGYTLMLGQAAELPMAHATNTLAYLARLKARPACERALVIATTPQADRVQ